ncbi:MAG: hypothetical protein VB058_05900 [Oscillospiraceae bacterium]|nr:hypothetical protein [Oscillospiraceae bacterium]
MIVKIVSVTTPDGTPRADDKYPVRIGSTFEVAQMQIGRRMQLDYISDNKGRHMIGTLETSTVQAIEHEADGTIKVTTRNSVYYLERRENT